MSTKRWSGLVLGYGLILLVTVMLGALTVPMSAMADGGGGNIPPPPSSTDTTTGGNSIGEPIIVDPTVEPSAIDLLMLTIDTILML